MGRRLPVVAPRHLAHRARGAERLPGDVREGLTLSARPGALPESGDAAGSADLVVVDLTRLRPTPLADEREQDHAREVEDGEVGVLDPRRLVGDHTGHERESTADRGDPVEEQQPEQGPGDCVHTRPSYGLAGQEYRDFVLVSGARMSEMMVRTDSHCPLRL
ncbi:hypothetical protein GCM10009831_23680 [Dietzia cercidiphylli]|uniref:Uncharacterized protein n=1 Tax=Dietzia cercidiphylli TaxID=498199 RepID=A0ABP4V0D9_9ACTN